LAVDLGYTAGGPCMLPRLASAVLGLG